MGLNELRVPILIGNYLGATMSGGQIWSEISVPDLRRKYKELKLSQIGVSFEEFKKARDESTHKLNEDQLGSAKRLLWHMAKSLTDMATSRAAELVSDQISLQTGYRTDMKTGLAFFLLRVGQLFRYSRATVWLRDPYDESMLRIGGAAWDTSLTKRERRAIGLRDIPVGKGLVGKVVEQGEDLLLNTRSEIEGRTKYANVAKFLIGLKSYISVPIKIGADTVGAIEMGIDEERAYHPPDRRVLHVLATHVGHYVRACRESNVFIEMLRSGDKGLFLKQVVKRLPGLIRGKGCSVFLRAESGAGPAFLAETTGLAQASKTTPIFYDEGEGATGWVLKYGETINMEAHTDMEARKKAAGEMSRKLHFLRKYCEDVRIDPAKPATSDEFAQMPFLATPILDEDGNVLGVVRITGRTGGNFSMEDQTAVEACANLIARFHQSQTASLSRKQAEIDALRSVDELMIAGADLRKVLSAVADGVSSQLSSAYAAIYVLEPSESMLTLYARSGPKSKGMENEPAFDGDTLDRLTRYDMLTEISEAAGPSSGQDERPSVPMSAAPAHVPRSEVVLPLLVEKRPVGLLWARSTEGETFSEENEFCIQRFAIKAACAIELSHKREELNVALATSRRQLVQWAKVAHLGTLAAGLAHEIRNPLNTITWTLNELMERELPDDIARELNEANDNAARIDRIVEGILSFAKQDIGKITRVDVGKLIGEVFNLLRKQINGAGIRVVNSSHKIPDVLGNKGMLQQVFLNIIINAVQAMTGQGGTLRITGGRINDKAEIVISDTGPGIPAEARERMFDPFFTTKGPRGGVGLGLSVSYGIVREHGGDIRLIDDPKAGAVLVTTIPLYKGRKL
jgi:signal transduction histidine kinase